MKKLHNKDEYSTQMKPEGGLQASLCSNNVLSCSSPLGFFVEKKYLLSDDTLDSISKLSNILKRVDRRMQQEGFYIREGKIIKNEN